MDSLIEIPIVPSDEQTPACDTPDPPELWPVRPAELGLLALALLVLRLVAG